MERRQRPVDLVEQTLGLWTAREKETKKSDVQKEIEPRLSRIRNTGDQRAVPPDSTMYPTRLWTDSVCFHATTAGTIKKLS